MRILWVKAGGLVPLDTGGKIRSYYILRELARRHEVTFFTFYAAHSPDTHRELERIFQRVVCHQLQIPAQRSWADYRDYGRDFFSGYPHAVAKYCQPGVSEDLHKIMGEVAFDAVVCDFVTPAAVIPWEQACPKILFTHNVEAVIWRRHYQVAVNPLWKAVCLREYLAMDHFERHYLERAQHVLTVSENDRDYFARFTPPSKITVIPTGVDVNYFQPEPDAERPNSMIFTGSMDWLPNEDAVFYFAKRVLPLIRRQVPDATLRVVGRRPSERLRALAAKDRGVQVTGQVEDIRPHVRGAAVYVVPLRIGGGTRLKIFEAMAMGKAVVSTSVGAEGLPVHDRRDILLADTPEHFARQVLGLLANREERIALGRAARALVEEKYSWAAVACRFEETLAEVVHGAAEAVPVRSPLITVPRPGRTHIQEGLDHREPGGRPADGRRRIPARAVSLLFHDVVNQGDVTSSGFLVPGANRYKLDRVEFERDLAAIAQAVPQKPERLPEGAPSSSVRGEPGAVPFFLTFDDGGSSAWSCIDGLLEPWGWKAHFLITTGYIGNRGFLGKNQIKALRRQGHVIGSHSASHPERMSACGWQRLLDEWETSVETLSDILGEPVTVASVPGGYYSKRVAEAAAHAGIRVLFTSEPTTVATQVDGCLVLGRFTILRGMPPAAVARLVQGKRVPRASQYLAWNLKKAGKYLGGEGWLAIRKRLLRRE
jgi:sugar transferase (PEP-CTERM/EpsH1 system associated)